MKRSIIYLGILIAILAIAQFIQMYVGANVLSVWDKPSTNEYFQILKSKTELLRDLEENQFAANKIVQDSFFTNRRDLYLLRESNKKQITWLEVVEDSPKLVDTIQFNKYLLPLDKYQDLSLINIERVNWVRDTIVDDNGTTILMSKQNLYEALLKADKAEALVSQPSSYEPLTWHGKLFFSPAYGPLLLSFIYFFIFGISKFSHLLGVVFKVSKRLVFDLGFSLWILWDTWRLVRIHYNRLIENGLDWPIWLTGEIIVSLLFIPGYFLFFFLKKKYFDRMDFADREAAKFSYIFILWSIFNLLHSYFVAQFYHYLTPDSFGHVVWLTPQIPAFALMLATGNFLNNFRTRYYQLSGKEKALVGAQKNKLQSEAELAALQSRVNPHFLYNALNSIASLASENAVKTEKMTLALSQFYKYSTNRKDELWTTIREELEALAIYLEIEEVRFGDQLIVTFDCPENLKEERIPRLLLQPLVENAIKYGYEATAKKINVSIVIEQIKELLTIKILDNGQPFSENMELGYGLRSVQKKLKLLYPNQYELDFENEPQKGVVITLNK